MKNQQEGYIQKIRPKILFVEDETLVGWSVSTALRKAGLIVDHVDSGEKAIVMLNSGNYDLVLTDLKLPEIDGIEVALRAKAKSPDVPVIILSSAGRQMISAALGNGTLDYYIEKPFDIDEVTAIVMRYSAH